MTDDMATHIRKHTGGRFGRHCTCSCPECRDAWERCICKDCPHINLEEVRIDDY